MAKAKALTKSMLISGERLVAIETGNIPPLADPSSDDHPSVDGSDGW
jgi:hypothetical protein